MRYWHWVSTIHWLIYILVHKNLRIIYTRFFPHAYGIFANVLYSVNSSGSEAQSNSYSWLVIMFIPGILRHALMDSCAHRDANASTWPFPLIGQMRWSNSTTSTPAELSRSSRWSITVKSMPRAWVTVVTIRCHWNMEVRVSLVSLQLSISQS